MTKEQTTIRLPAELRNAIQREADKLDISFNEMIHLLVCKGIEFIHRGLL